MSAALISACVLGVAMLAAAAEPPYNVVGEGFLSKPYTVNGRPGKGMRYAGPVVYTNEKPPIIFFPPPPKDAKPGFGALGIFGNKAPKSIKYVPMPHHDLPVLIYTSDKMPPIHVVHPPKKEGPTPYFTQGDEFRPPAGSLSSAYRGVFPEATSPHIVTSTYEIPATSYGTPMKAFGSSLGSLDLSSTGSSSQAEASFQKYEFPSSLGSGGLSPPPVSEPIPSNQRPTGSYKKVPPHILYGGHPPIHIFNEPDMFVQAPKAVPLKTYADMPPKASFGPSKPSFGPSKPSFGPTSINSFGTPFTFHRYHRPHVTTSFASPSSRPSYYFPSDNLIPSESSQNPSVISPPPNNAQKQEKNQTPASSSNEAAQSIGKPPTYSFNPPQTMFSFGPFSVEYGPPSEPFISFSEPTGSLSSFYGNMNDGASRNPNSITNNNINVNGNSNSNGNSANVEEQDGDGGWQPGLGPLLHHANGEGQIKEEAWDAPMPQALPPYQPSHMRPPKSFHGPRPNLMQTSVLLPSGPSPSFFSGSRLAHLFSAFKLKRKPKYAVAPKSMHKPPIIIYYGKKPPIHVYQKPDEEYGSQTSASSTSAITIASASSEGITKSNDNNNGNSKEAVQSTPIRAVELIYDASQNSEVRVAAPSSVPVREEDVKPAIIPAKPVDIFSSSDLQPSIYMARNSINTILVSDLGSGGKNIKTYIMRNSEDLQSSQEQSKDIISAGNINNDKSILQDRISGQVSSDPIQVSAVPVAVNEQEEKAAEKNEDNGSNEMTPTIVLAVGTPKQEEAVAAEDVQSEASEPVPAAIQSPSSFQTSLRQAEKDAEEVVEASSSS